MKILFTFFYVYPFTGGGIQTFISQLKPRLEEKGHTVDILALHPNLKHYYLVGKSIDRTLTDIHSHVVRNLLEPYPNLREFPVVYGTEVFRYCLELTALHYGLEKYDVIYAQDVISALSINRIKPPDTPLVMSTHGFLSGEVYHNLSDSTGGDVQQLVEYQYFKQLEDTWYRECKYVHVPSHWTRDILLAKTPITPEKISLFSYGIDHGSFLQRSTGVSPLVKPSGKKVILFAGRLVIEKGVRYLIEALSHLQQQRSDWVCWIAGDGHVRAYLEDQVRQLQLTDKVSFLGAINYVPTLMRQCDIFVLPGLQDTQPHVVMEAQLSGLPVIVSDAAGLPEMVAHGQNGFIFPSKNSVVLSDQLNLLLGDDILRKNFATKSRVWAAKKWSLQKMVDRFISLFERAIIETKRKS